MVGIQATCPVHGRVTVHGLVGGTGSVTIESSVTNCPICGRPSPIVDGTYEFVGDVLRAFRAAGVTRGQVEAFRAVLQAVEAGRLSAEQAEAEAASITPTFAALVAFTNKNADVISVLLAIIGLFFAIYTDYSSDQTTTQQLSDNRQLIAIQKQIYEELRRQGATGEPQVPKAQPKRAMQPPSPPRRPPEAGSSNRHERRKAARLARRQPRS